MVCGVPRMCIRMIGTFRLAAPKNTSGSSRPAETSLIQSAPASSAAAATGQRVVSTERAIDVLRRIARIAGMMRSICSSAATRNAPGRVDSPPMSSISAPAAAISIAASAADSGSVKRPPSLKLSGVIFTTPITSGRRLASRSQESNSDGFKVRAPNDRHKKDGPGNYKECSLRRNAGDDGGDHLRGHLGEPAQIDGKPGMLRAAAPSDVYLSG